MISSTNVTPFPLERKQPKKSTGEKRTQYQDAEGTSLLRP